MALPVEHGGWSLTLEPVVLGLLVAPSISGLALGLAGLVAFAARTPLKVVLVDRRRSRRLPRTALAGRVLRAELSILLLLGTVAILTAEGALWWPLLAAAPLIGLELWYDMRSRSRRVVPELAGSVGIASLAAATALGGGAEAALAAGLWLVMAARSVAAIPFVRVQLLRAKNRAHTVWHSDVAQIAAVLLGAVGWITDLVPVAAVVALACQATYEIVALRRSPQRAALLGAQQVVIGLTVVLVTGLAVIAP